jgi:transcription initiation factor TFIIE subunit alpha
VGDILAVRKNAAKSRLRRPKKAPKKAPKRESKKDIAARELRRKEQELVARKLQEEKEHLQRVSRILADASVRQNLIGIGGENALAIVRNFFGNHSDEELAKKLKIKISDVRATLNKLHNEGLVNYIREKDSETGWYSYSWSLNQDRMEKWASDQSLRLSSLGGDSGVEYYFCPTCGTSSITNFESASDCGFKCERCSRMLEFIDEKKMIELHEKSKL